MLFTPRRRRGRSSERTKQTGASRKGGTIDSLAVHLLESSVAVQEKGILEKSRLISQ